MDNKEGTENPDAGKASEALGSLGLSFSDREKKNLMTFLSIGIILVEFAVTIAAVCYGIIKSTKHADGSVEFQFPWIPYGVAVIVAPEEAEAVSKLLTDAGENVFRIGEVEKNLSAHLAYG